MLPAGIPHTGHDLGGCSIVSVNAIQCKSRAVTRISGPRGLEVCWNIQVLRHRFIECHSQPSSPV